MFAKWRKTGKSNKEYAIAFPIDPLKESQRYSVYVNGEIIITLSTGLLIRWYIRSVHGNRTRPDGPFFPHMSRPNRRTVYTTWFKTMFTLVLPMGSPLPALIKPHSPRAGWATDRAHDNTTIMAIMAEGRWKSRKTVCDYTSARESDR